MINKLDRTPDIKQTLYNPGETKSHKHRKAAVGKRLESPNIGALIVRIGFWCTFCYNHNQEPPKNKKNSIGKSGNPKSPKP